MKKILLMVFVLACAGAAVGQNGPTGNTLIGFCDSALKPQPSDAVEAVNAGFCLGLVNGVWDMLSAVDAIDTPDDSTVSQMVRVVDKYLHDHPEELAERHSLLVAKALLKAFPKKEKPSALKKQSGS